MCKKHGLDRLYSTSIYSLRKMGSIIDKKTFFEIVKFDTTAYHRLSFFLDNTKLQLIHA